MLWYLIHFLKTNRRFTCRLLFFSFFFLEWDTEIQQSETWSVTVFCLISQAGGMWFDHYASSVCRPRRPRHAGHCWIWRHSAGRHSQLRHGMSVTVSQSSCFFFRVTVRTSGAAQVCRDCEIASWNSVHVEFASGSVVNKTIHSFPTQCITSVPPLVYLPE